jgi:DNA-binding transcriptional MerR regulator
MANPQNLKPLNKGYDPRRNMKGRPRVFISKMKEQGYNLSEIQDAMQVLMAMSPEELTKIKMNKDATVLEVTVASAILKSIQKGDLFSIETLLTRVYGKPKEKIEQDINITNHVIKLKFGGTEEEEEDGEEKDRN